MRELFHNSIRVSGFILRREKVFIAVWLGALLLIAAVMLLAFERQFTQEELQGLLIMKENPAHVALQGPFFEVNNFQVGHFYAVEMHLFTMIAVSIFNIILVMQTTRGDEEKGRYEVLRSLPIGRLAVLHGTMASTFMVNMVLAVTHGVLLSLLRVGGITIGGAFIYGTSLGVTGFFFAALAALLAQFSHSTRAVTGYAFMVLIGSYLLRAVGDVTWELLAWLSPLGLPLRVEAFVANRREPLLIMMGVTLLLCSLAYALNNKRDIGQGFFPEKQGSAHASFFLRTPLGLTWRQNRGTLFAWAIGLYGFGAAFGGILRDAEHFAGESGALQMLLATSGDFSTVELFVMFLNVSFAVVCVAPIWILLFKMLREEKEGRGEPILSGPVSRLKYMISFATLAFGASLLMPLVTSMGLWSVSSLMLEVPLAFGATLQGLLIYLPALWIMLGLGMFAMGIFPKGAMVCWAYFTHVFLVGFFGELLNMPQWAMNLSPFSHIPQLPLEEVNVLVLLVLTAIALGLAVIGLVGYRQRDVG